MFTKMKVILTKKSEDTGNVPFRSWRFRGKSRLVLPHRRE
jgi:hypothetical protein